MRSLIRAKRNWAEWKQPHGSPLQSSQHPSSILITRIVGWIPPLDCVIKLKFDGSLPLAGAVVGYLLHDSQGRLIKARTRFIFATPILVSEATALRDGLQAAINASYQRLHIEDDNQIVIQAVLGDILIL